MPIELALRKRATPHSLAARRRNFAAQMHDMAVSDLSNVSKRLKGLHSDLERETGRRWTHYDLADAMKIAPRTFQSWENGEVENRDGKGYDKMARFYSRKLGRKISRQWILFGDEQPAKAVPAPDPFAPTELAELAASVAELRREMQAARTELRAELASARTVLEDLRRNQRPAGRRPAASSN